MKKRRLEIDYGFDFSLFGITSILKPFKLAWELNQALKINLARTADLPVRSKTGEDVAYLQFLHQTELTAIRLFKNKPEEPASTKWLLVPEHPRFDYILMSVNRETDNTQEVIDVLKNISTIEWSAFLPLATLKSKENFIF